jgi:hypothetical protein
MNRSAIGARIPDTESRRDTLSTIKVRGRDATEIIESAERSIDQDNFWSGSAGVSERPLMGWTARAPAGVK